MMTIREVSNLLGFIAGFDRRTTSGGDDVAWTAAAQAAGWTFELARRAVVEHYANSTEWLMPAHITRRIAEARRAVYAGFELPAHPPELVDDGPRFVAWAKDRAREHMARGMAEWASSGQLPSPLEIEA